MGILYGLIAALCWGCGDFVITTVSRERGPVQTLFLTQSLGMLLIGAIILLRGDFPSAPAQIWALAIGANLFNVTGTFLLYRAFAIGTLSIVSPIASAYAAFTAVLAFFSGERLEALGWLGTGLVIVGVVTAARAAENGKVTLRGVPEAVGVVICFGLYFWLTGFITPALGPMWPVLIGRILAVLLVSVAFAVRRERPITPNPRMLRIVGLAVILDTSAFVAFNVGIASDFTTIVTALSSIFSAVTVILAWVFLRERLSAAQWAGVATILLGVLFVSL